jgi:hypothetical protein
VIEVCWLGAKCFHDLSPSAAAVISAWAAGFWAAVLGLD